jgi:hypothetical protein
MMVKNVSYRDIWESNFGKIPIDEDGRTYEIHHIDGNNKNNNIDNLLCVSIKDHFKIHKNNGDWGALVLIAKRMNLDPDYISKIQLGKKRPGIGGVKPGTVPWNKNKKNCFSEEVVSKIREGNLKFDRRGEKHPRSKLTKEQVSRIKYEFNKKEEIEGVGKIQKNGLKLSYVAAFSKKYSEFYNCTDTNIKHIVTGKTWVDVKPHR